MNSLQFAKAGLAIALSVVSMLASAQTAAVKVDGAWARATVPGQKGTGAFMTLTPKKVRGWSACRHLQRA